MDELNDPCPHGVHAGHCLNCEADRLERDAIAKIQTKLKTIRERQAAYAAHLHQAAKAAPNRKPGNQENKPCEK